MKKALWTIPILVILLIVLGVMIVNAQGEPKEAGQVFVKFDVGANVNLKFYSDEAGTTELTGYYLGSLNRGKVQQQPVFVKNTGEAVSVNVVVDGSSYVNFTPASFQLAVGQTIAGQVTVTVPPDAPLGPQEAVIHFQVPQ